MDKEKLREVWSTLPEHFFVTVEENLGYGRYLLVDEVTKKKCRVEGASVNFEKGQRLEIQKWAYTDFADFLKGIIQKILGIRNPLDYFIIMDMSSSNMSRIKFRPVGDELEFAVDCWESRRKYGSTYRR